MTQRPALVLRSARLRAARHVVVAEQVDVSATAGEVVAVEGRNGAGKSTVLAAAAGLLPSGPGSHRPSRVGFAPERSDVLPRLTVRRWLTGLARTAGLAPRVAALQVDDVIDRLGLTAVGDRRLRELSRGNLQRVLVAQALLGPPELLVLDEPAGGLDADGVRRVGEAVRHASSGGSVVLVARHRSAPVPLPVGVTWLVDDGRLRTVPRPADAVRGPLWMRVETADGTVREVPEADVPDVLRSALDAGLAVVRVEPVARAAVAPGSAAPTTVPAGVAGRPASGDALAPRSGVLAQVLQGALHRARLLTVSQWTAAPALLFLAVLAFVYATDAGRPVTAAALTAVVLAPVLTWVTVLAHLVDGRLVGRAFAAHVGGVGRARLAADLAAVPFLLAATVAACVWPLVSQHAQPHPPAVLAQMAVLHLAAGVLGIGVGALVVPPLVEPAGWRVCGATAVYLVLLLVPVWPLRPLLELTVDPSTGPGAVMVAAGVAAAAGALLVAVTAAASRGRS